LLKYRQKGGAIFPCQECVQEHDVAALLTGFANKGTPQLEEFVKLQGKMQDVAASVDRIEVFAADSADSMRRTLKAVSIEVSDCPRLFSIGRGRRTLLSRIRVGQMPIRLSLWCEHPGEWHPTDGSYDVQVDRQWWASVKPYAAMVFRALKLASSLAGAVVDTGIGSGSLAVAKEDLEAMAGLLEDFSTDLTPVDKSVEFDSERIGLSLAEGESLRAFRRMLFEIDETHSFGGLRRVLSASGDLLWVCQQHYALYDPGLPDLSNSAASLDRSPSVPVQSQRTEQESSLTDNGNGGDKGRL
jgi:hypothetical protein